MTRGRASGCRNPSKRITDWLEGRRGDDSRRLSGDGRAALRGAGAECQHGSMYRGWVGRCALSRVCAGRHQRGLCDVPCAELHDDAHLRARGRGRIRCLRYWRGRCAVVAAVETAGFTLPTQVKMPSGCDLIIDGDWRHNKCTGLTPRYGHLSIPARSNWTVSDMSGEID